MDTLNKAYRDMKQFEEQLDRIITIKKKNNNNLITSVPHFFKPNDKHLPELLQVKKAIQVAIKRIECLVDEENKRIRGITHG